MAFAPKTTEKKDEGMGNGAPAADKPTHGVAAPTPSIK